MIKRSPDFRLNHIFKRVELDDDCRQKVQSGELLVKYALILQDRLRAQKHEFEINTKALMQIEFEEGDAWDAIMVHCLDPLIKLDAITVSKLEQNDIPTVL